MIIEPLKGGKPLGSSHIRNDVKRPRLAVLFGKEELRIDRGRKVPGQYSLDQMHRSHRQVRDYTDSHGIYGGPMKIIVATCILLASSAVVASAAPAITPEPGTILLLGGGLVAMGIVGWRRNRRK